MTALERPGAAGEGVRSEPRPLRQIFPLADDESRSSQMQQTWVAFCREMDEPVRAALDAGRSAPEIAYAVGDLVHNYFRTRGVTLTSYELRHLVAELLSLHAPVPPSDGLSTMVSFAGPGPEPSGWTGAEPEPLPESQPAVVVQPVPSGLVTRIERHQAAFDRLLLRIVEATRPGTAGLARSAALETIGRVVGEVLQDEPGDWPAAARERLALAALSEICGLGLIDRLWADRSIQAVLVNGPKAVYVERDGVVEPADESFRDAGHLDELIRRLTHGAAAGVVEVRLRDGGSGTVVFPPTAPAGPVLAIRRGDPGEATFQRLIASELLDSRTADLLRIAARSRLNIVVVGPRGSGKTAVLAAIARDLEGSRVVTVAPHRAFRWQSPTKIELVAEPPGLRALVGASLRLRPDLLVLDSVALQDLPSGRQGLVASLAVEPPARVADLVVKLGRAADGLFRVVAVQDVNGADVFPAPAVIPAFSEAVHAAGYGAVLQRLVGQHCDRPPHTE